MHSKERSLKVLALDDSEADLRILAEAFKECGSNCVLVRELRNKDALARLRADHFDLIISELGRDLAGLDFVRQVRELRILTPIVIFTSMPLVSEVYQAGANALIAKSIELDDLLATIRAVIVFWLHVVTAPSPVISAKVNETQLNGLT